MALTAEVMRSRRKAPRVAVRFPRRGMTITGTARLAACDDQCDGCSAAREKRSVSCVHANVFERLLYKQYIP